LRLDNEAAASGRRRSECERRRGEEGHGISEVGNKSGSDRLYPVGRAGKEQKPIDDDEAAVAIAGEEAPCEVGRARARRTANEGLI
jgi:hypothetical protein